jgi:hypothetical protein
MSEEYGMRIVEVSIDGIQKNENKKGWWNRFIDRMIRSNEQTFGTGRINCCTLSRNEHPQKKNS